MAAVESVLLKPLQRNFMSLPTYAASIDSIRQAAERLAGHIHQTPLVSCQTIDARAGRELLLKCENQQKVGAFKFRGATNAVALLSDEQAAQGVVTHSSGNHAQALEDLQSYIEEEPASPDIDSVQELVRRIRRDLEG